MRKVDALTKKWLVVHPRTSVAMATCPDLVIEWAVDPASGTRDANNNIEKKCGGQNGGLTYLSSSVPYMRLRRSAI